MIVFFFCVFVGILIIVIILTSILMSIIDYVGQLTLKNETNKEKETGSE